MIRIARKRTSSFDGCRKNEKKMAEKHRIEPKVTASGKMKKKISRN